MCNYKFIFLFSIVLLIRIGKIKPTFTYENDDMLVKVYMDIINRRKPLFREIVKPILTL